MANKNNNDDSLIVEMGVDTKNAEKEIKEFFNKVNTKKYIKIEIDPTSSKKQEILTKETATWTEKTGKYTERNITLTKQYNTTKAQGNKEAEKQLISEQKVEGSVRLQKETLKEAINLLKQQTEYVNKSAKSTGEQRVAYELLAKEAEKKLKTIANEVEQGVKVNSLLRENSSYLQQEYNLRTAMVNKDMTVKAEQQKLAYLKEELALSQKLMATQNQYAIYKANSDAALKNYRTAFQNVGDSWLNSSSFLGKAINTFQYGAIGKAQAEVYQLMSDGAQAIIQFENGIVDLRRTLENVTENELTQFGETALRYAKEYGQELANVQDSMTELARAGIDKDQLESMTQTVMIGLNTTEIKDAEEMVGYLVSAIKQLGMSMEDSMVIIDSWNMLADRYAVHTDDFAKAIAKAGAASKNMGLDLYDVNAMVTILGEATQASGEQIGNALRSLEVRLLRPDTISTLEKYGIVVKKDADSFLSFQEILNNVAEVIKDLPDDSIVLSDIMDAMGGSWRKNWITTLTNDWDRFDALVEEQADNIGYSARENEIAMDTLEKKIISLKQAWLELFVTIGNESGVVDVLKGLVDGTTGLLELATNTELGKFITSLIPAATALGVVMKTVQAIGDAKGGTMVSNLIGSALSMGGNLKSNQQIAEQYLKTLEQTNISLEQRLAVAEVLDKKFKTNTAIMLENERAEKDYQEQLKAVNRELEAREKRFAELETKGKSGVGLSALETIELEENGRAIANLKQQQDNLAESHKNAAKQADINAKATKSLGSAITALRAKMIAARAAAFAFGTVMTMLGAVLLSVAVTKVIEFFDDLHVSLEEQKEITENLVSEIQTLKSELSDLEQQRDTSVSPQEIKELEFKIALQKESIRLKE